MRALAPSLLLLAAPAWAAHSPVPEPDGLDLACTELRLAVRRALPNVRKGKVTIAGCARVPGVRAVVVLRDGRGVIGDPLELAAAPTQNKLKEFPEHWSREPVVFVGDRGDPARAAIEALDPIGVDRVVAHPGGFVLDVVIKAGPNGQPITPDPVWIAVAGGALNADLRIFNPASWTVARIDAAPALQDALSLDEASVTALIDHGLLTADDLAGTPPAALSRALAIPLATAQSWVDAAAQWTEYAATPADRRRGW